MVAGDDAGTRDQSGSRSRMAAIVSETVSPANAIRPVSISYSTQPNAQMSVRLSTGLPACLLRTHVRRGAERRRPSRVPPTVTVGDCLRSTGASVTCRRLRQPEVQHLHDAVWGDLDVRRFEISVNDPLLMCRVKGIGDLSRDGQGIGQRNGPTRDAVGERLALDQFQHERADAIRLFESVDRADVGMIERREHARFAFEPRQPIRIVR